MNHYFITYQVYVRIGSVIAPTETGTAFINCTPEDVLKTINKTVNLADKEYYKILAVTKL